MDVGVVVMSGGGAGILVLVVVLRERRSAAEHCGERRESCKLSKSVHKFTSDS
jgi:hypothetical protein